MKKFYLLAFLLLFCVGCSLTRGNAPSTLTSSEEQFTIPAGTTFQAIQKPKFSVLTSFTAKNDLVVLDKGNLLELEQSANAKLLKGTRTAKTKGIMWGILGSVFSITAAFGTKWGLEKLKSKFA